MRGYIDKFADQISFQQMQGVVERNNCIYFVWRHYLHFVEWNWN